MQIVIKIPEDYYKAIKEIPVEQSTADMLIIRYGTPLPKGHGRLKDENEIKQMIEDAKVKNEFSKTFAENIIKFAPTIIEADKAGEEE